MCGSSIPPNPSNMCVPCLRARVDITEGIPKQVILHWCKGCGKYLAPPAKWLVCELESRELLALCLRSIRGLNRVKLIDASFIWTEPHSKRLKIKLRVQREVFNGAILQQIFMIEFIVTNQYCDECHRLAAENTWNTVVQLRQKVEHKRTFLFLEQLILKYRVHRNAVGIQEFPDGLDFYYTSKASAIKLLEFLQARVPIRYKTAQRLISADEQNNSYKYKYTFAVEIAPVCRDDLVVLPKKLAQHLGTISQLVLCTRVNSVVQFIDPLTCQTAELHDYWRSPFRSLVSQAQLVQYVVIDIEQLGEEGGHGGNRFMLAEATVARVSDFGTNDLTFVVLTHLGHLLQAGDYALGYDMENGNYNDPNFDALSKDAVPDCILVRKYFNTTKRRNRPRHWKLQELAKVRHVDEASLGKRAARAEGERVEDEREAFMQELEENPAMRAEINLFKADNFELALAARAAAAAAAAGGVPGADGQAVDDDGDELPDVAVEELLDDIAEMTLDDDDAEPDDEAADGQAGADGAHAHAQPAATSAGAAAAARAAASSSRAMVTVDEAESELMLVSAADAELQLSSLQDLLGGTAAAEPGALVAVESNDDDASLLALQAQQQRQLAGQVGSASARPGAKRAAKRAAKRKTAAGSSQALTVRERDGADDEGLDL